MGQNIAVVVRASYYNLGVLRVYRGAVPMKTSELTGVELDWAVAKCEGIDWYASKGTIYEEHGEISFVFNPSTEWAQGGPIIEREHICLMYYPTHWSALAETGQRHSRGATPLEAAMRCYVVSKLGADVQLPEELCQ